MAIYNDTAAEWIGIGNNNTYSPSCLENASAGRSHASCASIGYIAEETTLYIWAKYNATGENTILINGFCITYYGYHISRRTSWTDCNIRIPIVMYHAYVKPLCITNNGTYKCTGWTRRIAVPGYDRNQKRIARYCHPYADKGYMVICHINGTRVCRVMPCVYSLDRFTCKP